MAPEKKKFKIPYTDLKIKINKYIQQRQHGWNNNKYNKLLEIKPVPGEWKEFSEKAERKKLYHPDSA